MKDKLKKQTYINERQTYVYFMSDEFGMTINSIFYYFFMRITSINVILFTLDI